MNEEITAILDACCTAFSVTIDEVRSPRKNMALVNCRRAFVMLVKENYGISDRAIGMFINKVSSAVLYLRMTEQHDRHYVRALKELRTKHTQR